MDLSFANFTDQAPATGAGADARPMPPETFGIFVDDDRYAVPTLHLVTADDPDAALAIAVRIVAESPHHLGAEVCRDGQRIAGLGSFAMRQQPLGAPARKPDSAAEP